MSSTHSRPTVEIAFVYDEQPVGGAAIDAYRLALCLNDTLSRPAKPADAILFGSGGEDRKWETPPAGPAARARRPAPAPEALWPLRQPASRRLPSGARLDASPIRPDHRGGRVRHVLCVRELTGGIYFGAPKGIEERDGRRVSPSTPWSTASRRSSASPASASPRPRGGEETHLDRQGQCSPERDSLAGNSDKGRPRFP